MAKKRGLWAEVQRDRALRAKKAEQQRRAAVREGVQAQREYERRRRIQEREAATNDRERKRLLVEERKAEAAAMTADVQARVEELEAVLADGIAQRAGISFSQMKRALDVRPFDPAGLDVPLPAPEWADFAPTAPGRLGRAFGGAAKHEQATVEAMGRYDEQLTAHATAESDRRRQLEARREAYERQVAAAREAVEQHNAGVDAFEDTVQRGESEPVAQLFTLVLDDAAYPEGFPHGHALVYDPEPRHLVVDFELPPQDVVPVERDYRYVQTRQQIESAARPAREIRDRYAQLISQVALRTLDSVFAADPAELLDQVTFNGRVSTIDKATGQPIRPHLITVTATREAFDDLVLTDLDPVACLRHLNALVSPHPYDLEPVRPLVDFEALLARFKFVEGMDAIAGLDSRRDLLDMTPTEFEHFVKGLFEEMGMKAWVTQASNDDGVDAVATNEDPVFGGLCVIQAKRYRKVVGVESVRALAGTMEDKHATKGILVTTSWVGPAGHAFAQRNGRIQLIEGQHLKHLCLEHLELDVLISLPPRRRKPASTS